MMKVLRASRKFSALSLLDGTRNGNSLRPAKQISPLGKIWAIGIPLLPVVVLRLLREIRILVKIPYNLKFLRLFSKARN